jgi:glyoxylase-like metal-dependent hydrolase (beta-lactamase superfamily II)
VLIVRLEVGPLVSNAYLLRDDDDEEGAVIDPGAEGNRIVQRCRAEGIVPRLLINTHGHVDHIGANAALKAAFPDALLCVGARDAGRLTDPVANLTALFGGSAGGPAPDVLLEDGDELPFGAVTLRVIETPGHTPGGICLLAPDESPPQLFCGDLVFRRGVGRSDLPGGDPEALAGSIRRRVFTLPGETVIWPGHGQSTTVEEERLENPFVGSAAQLHR